MRIRRYAARLLSAGSATPSSPPPQPAASWLHAAADDCCAFCELSCAAPQEAPDAVKQKGHIAGRAPESEVKGDERVGLAQRPPAPEVKKCKIDHGIPVNKAALGRDDTRGAALVSEAHAEPAVTAGPFVVSDAAIDQDGKCRTSPGSEAASEPEAKEGGSLVNGSATERQVSRSASAANEVATEPEATEAVSLVSKATTGPGVTGEPSPVSEFGTELGVISRTSLVNEVSTGPGLTERVCIVDQAATDPGVAIAVPQVNGTDSLTNEGAVEPDATGGASFVHDAAELEVTGDDSTNKAIGEPEGTGRASCHGHVDAALGEPRPPDCDLEVGNVLVRNTCETVASTVQPSGYDTADVGGSVNTTSNVPVRAKSQIDEDGTPHNISTAPIDSRLFDVVARSIGKSGRTDVICYARRKGKRKMELLEVKAENVELEDGVICDQFDEMQTCESVTSTAGSADVKLADIKRELMDSSAASKVKKMKINKFECDIDYCRMTFKTRAELSVHKKNTCTVKSCNRHFRSHKYLRRHQSVHNDDMPYKCPWEGCGMAFKLSWDRAEHFQVHTGEKPYKCMTPGCSKIYKFVSDFTRHRRRCKPQR
ncbi:hypothetical protein ACP70R_013023 [Stipagrostis hirtigluma subsp. patula]